MTSPSVETPPDNPPPRKSIRWWPAAVILAGVALRIALAWGDSDLQRQYKVMRTGGAVLLGGALLLAWVMFFSRARWRTRWIVLLGVIAAILAGVGTFRFVGVTGDLVPLLEPRWKARARPAAIATSSAPMSQPAETPAVGDGSEAKADFPQFLGATRDGVVTGVRLASDWKADPPKLLWRQPVGSGWGGFAIVGNLALTLEQDGPEEVVACYEATTGRRRWEHRDQGRYDNPIGGIGPRTTPTVVNGRVYTLGSVGRLNCLELATGVVRWSTNVLGASPRPASELEWGLSSSPLVYSNLVVIAPLGIGDTSLLAFNAESGRLEWQGGTARPHYSSPRLETIRGVPQILSFNSHGAAGHDPATGALLWDYAWRGGHPHITDPRVTDPAAGRVLISSGYGTGSELIEVDRHDDGHWAATNQVWHSMRLKSKFANVVLRDGFVYGLDDGRMVCLDLTDGTRRWDGERLGHGQLLLVGDAILATAENGEVVLIDAEPTAYRERGRFAAVSGKTWNPPALAGDLLIVRNDREAAAYRLPRAR